MKGAPAKPMSGDVELADQDPHRLGDPGQVDLGFEVAEPGQVLLGGERLFDDGPDAGDDVHPEADGGDGDHDVGVEDGGVDAVAADRLQGDLGGQVRLPDDVEDAAGAAQGPVLGQRAPGLAHEPHGDLATPLAPARPQERRGGGHRLRHGPKVPVRPKVHQDRWRRDGDALTETEHDEGQLVAHAVDGELTVEPPGRAQGHLTPWRSTPASPTRPRRRRNSE